MLVFADTYLKLYFLTRHGHLLVFRLLAWTLRLIFPPVLFSNPHKLVYILSYILSNFVLNTDIDSGNFSFSPLLPLTGSSKRRKKRFSFFSACVLCVCVLGRVYVHHVPLDSCGRLGTGVAGGREHLMWVLGS